MARRLVDLSMPVHNDMVSFPRVVRPTISELLQSEVGAVQRQTTAPQPTQLQPGQPAGPGQLAAQPEYEVLATMRLSTYVPSAVRVEVSAVTEATPVAATGSKVEARDES